MGTCCCSCIKILKNWKSPWYGAGGSTRQLSGSMCRHNIIYRMINLHGRTHFSSQLCRRQNMFIYSIHTITHRLFEVFTQKLHIYELIYFFTNCTAHRDILGFFYFVLTITYAFFIFNALRRIIATSVM